MSTSLFLSCIYFRIRMPSTDKFNAIQEYLYKIGGPILILLGTVSCLISLYVFTKKNFRKNPCSIYLISINIVNLLHIYCTILALTMVSGYNIQIGLYNIFLCHLVLYLNFLFDILGPCYLILLSIDRLLISSSSASIRRLSTHRLAYRSILIVTLFWILFHIHAFLFTKVINLNEHEEICYFQKGLYTIIVGYYILITKGLLIPFLLILFGIFTLKNIRRLNSAKSKDQQFQQILLIEITIHISCTIPLSILIIYQQISFQFNQQQQLMPIHIYTRIIARFLTHIPFCISCCEYLLVSDTFRTELKNFM